MKHRENRWLQMLARGAGIPGALILFVAIPALGSRTAVAGQTIPDPKGRVKGQAPAELLSSGGYAAVLGPRDHAASGPNDPGPGERRNDRGGNTFVNDPCLDPPSFAAPPENLTGTVQSETEIAVLNARGSMGRKMVVGYNDSRGFYDNRQGLSGYAYSTNGGKTWIDGGGLPPRGTTDRYFGDPVVVVDNSPRTFDVRGQAVTQDAGVFYYSSIYQNSAGLFTLSVNRGTFEAAPAVGPESVASTRCSSLPETHGVPDPPTLQKERIVWEPPVEAVTPVNFGTDGALLDKEWLYVDQKDGTLYLTYTRFAGAPTFETPIELVRSFDGGRTWTPPTTIVANEDFDFNTATQAAVTPTGRVIVTWYRRRFSSIFPFEETERAIEYAYSDDGGLTFTPEKLVAIVNPQSEPFGYNRGRIAILNQPYIAVDKGEDDLVDTPGEKARPGFGNIYIAYFHGKTPLGSASADIQVSRSLDDGTTFEPPVAVNDDPGDTSHVFPSVQVNKHGHVYVGWLDRRNDPLNILTDAWADVSRSNGVRFGRDTLQSDVATSWFVRADAGPNFGDYNSSELLGFDRFVMTWADGRFPAQGPLDPTLQLDQRQATPDTIFTVANGLEEVPPDR